MKIRNGFVSNSSSSSFIIVGIEMPRGNPKEVLDMYELFGVELDEKLTEYILDDDYDPYDMPDFGDGLRFCHTEYDGDYVGITTDPTCLSLEECAHGFVSKEALDKLLEVSAKTGKRIQVLGGTEYC